MDWYACSYKVVGPEAKMTGLISMPFIQSFLVLGKLFKKKKKKKKKN